MFDSFKTRGGVVNRRDFMAGALLGATTACSTGGDGSAASETTIFTGATVLPVDAGFSEAEALAIRGNQVLAVGSEEDVRVAAGDRAKIVDVAGRTILPGFIEPHMHFALLAGIGHFRDIGPFQHPTFAGALEALREVAAAAGPDDWIEGRQFDPIMLDPPRDLTTRELDTVAPDRPVWILNASGHIAYVNSKTLEIAGITRDTPAPKGAEYGRYEDGTPNGILYGTGAHLPVLMKNAKVLERMQTGFVEAGIGVGDDASKLGITTLCDQATGGLAGMRDLDFYRQMYAEGRMKTRIRASLFCEKEQEWDEAGIKFGGGDALLRVVGWKIVTDGSNQGFTGRQRAPYWGKRDVGLFYVEPGVLRDMVSRRGSQGWPLVLHGNGDAAIDSILDAMEAAREMGIDVRSLRCRIEHCSILHDEQIARIKDLGMGPSFLINHVHYWGHVMRDQVFGPEKVLLLDRCASVEKAGITWTNHTDAPVSPLGSLHKIRVAVVRDLWKEPETILAPDECVSVEAAIRAVTSNAAWQCHSEHEIGSLEPGKLADLVVLEQDPRAVEPTQISNIRVLATWMDGKQVFEG